MGENVDNAANAVDSRVKASGESGVTPEVRGQIDNAINDNGLRTQQDFAALTERLEKSGTLPTLLLDREGVDSFFEKHAGRGDKQLTRQTLADIASGKTPESPYNRLLATAMLSRFTDIDREAQNYGAMPGLPNTRLSRDEVANWARRQRGGESFTPEIPRNGLTWVSNSARLQTRDGKLVELRSFSGGSNDFGADGRDKVGTYHYSKVNGQDVITKIEVPGATYHTKDNDGQNWMRNGERIENVRINADGTFSFDQKLKDGTQVRTTHNANHSEVSVDADGRVRQVRYADGSTRDISYGPDGKPNRIVESGRDGKTRTFTANPDDPKGDWLVDGKPANGQRTYREPRVGANGDFRYVGADGKPMIQTTDGLVRKDNNPQTEEPESPGDTPPAEPRRQFQLGADQVKITKDGDDIVKVERTNPSGETETITRNADGSYMIERKGRDGSTTTEFARPGTFKMHADGAYEYETTGGARVRQNADGSREITDPSGATTKFVFDPRTGEPTRIERTIPDGKGGTRETLERTADGKWILTNPNMGGNVTDVQIRSDGSYSFKFNDRTITQETTRNIREIKRENGDTTRIGYNNQGQPEFVIRISRDAQGKEHREELKSADGGKTWTATVDGQEVKVKDVKVHPSGAYEYTRESDGVKVKQLPDGSRSETRALEGGGERTITTRPDGSREIVTKRKDGSTSTLTTDKDGKPVRIVEKDKNGRETAVIEKGADGKWKKTTTDAQGNKKEVNVSEPKLNADGSFSYEQEVGKRGRKVTMNDDGTMNYQVKNGDNLWRIMQDILEERLGRKPTGKEIMAGIKAVAGANGVRNANRIRTGQNFRIA